MLVHTYNFSTWEARTEKPLELCDLPGQHSDFLANQYCTIRSCFKMIKENPQTEKGGMELGRDHVVQQ